MERFEGAGAGSYRRYLSWPSPFEMFSANEVMHAS
jgi:hypothetical protein